jgi:hypothetical protein
VWTDCRLGRQWSVASHSYVSTGNVGVPVHLLAVDFAIAVRGDAIINGHLDFVSHCLNIGVLGQVQREKARVGLRD